jgi:hypothetical protein
MTVRSYGDDVAIIGWMVAGESGVDTCLVDNEWYEDT